MITLAACTGDDGAGQASNIAPSAVVQALQQEEWTPIADWEEERFALPASTGGAGIIINYNTDDELGFGFHAGNGWEFLDVPDPLQPLHQPRAFATPRSFIVVSENQLIESTDGVEWTDPITVRSVIGEEFEIDFLQDGDTTIVSIRSQTGIIDEWHSDEFGEWESVGSTDFQTLFESADGRPHAGPAARQYLSNGTRIVDITPDDASPGLLAVFAEEQWVEAQPFDDHPGWTGGSTSRLDLTWSHSAERWFAVTVDGPVSRDTRPVLVSESIDGIDWNAVEINPPVPILPSQVTNGRFIFDTGTNTGTTSTTDFVEWDIESKPADLVNWGFSEIGGGTCLGFSLDVDDFNGIHPETGPCPWPTAE